MTAHHMRAHRKTWLHHLTWRHITSHHVTSHRMTGHFATNGATSPHVTSQPATLVRLRSQPATWHHIPHHVTLHHHHRHTTETQRATTKTPPPDGTAAGWCTQKTRFGHSIGWLPCVHSTGKFCLCPNFLPLETSTPVPLYVFKDSCT